MASITLFSAQTENGDSTNFDAELREYVLVRVYGTFNGCTVQASADFDASGTFCDIVDGSWTAEDIKQIYVKPGARVKLTLSSAGGSTSINADVLTEAQA